MKVGLGVFFLIFYSLHVQAQFFSGTFSHWEDKNNGELRIYQRQNSKYKLQSKDSSIISKETGKFNYSVYSVQLQKNSSGTMQNMHFILGVDTAHNVFMVTKQDGVALKSGFEIHYVQKIKLDKGASFELLPVKFLIDSIVVYQVDPVQKKYEKAFCNIIFNVNWKDKFDPRGLPHITFKIVDYLSVPLLIDNITYELCVFSHPLTQNFYNEENIYFNTDNFLYTLFRTKGNVRDSLVNSGGNFSNLKNITSDNLLQIGENKIYISDVSLDYTSFYIHVTKDSTARNIDSLPFPEKYLVKDLLQRKNVDLFKSEKEYKLFSFGGSWCKPCTESLPALNKYIQEFKNEVELTTILVDRSETVAKNYTIKHRLKSPVFYERLDGTKSLQTLFSIWQFPTFILLDKMNRMIMRSISIEEISIETYRLFSAK